MRQPVCYLLAAFFAAATLVWAADDGWTDLFNGQDTTGWEMIPSGHGTEAIWEVLDGVLTGRQNPPGKGGILATVDAYGDCEVTCELNPEWPMDSGLFLRAQPGGKAYQITVDYRGGGEVGTLYAEGCGGWLQQNKEWAEHYHKGEWNTIRASIKGNPPHVQSWLNDAQLVDFQDDQKRLPDTGRIAVQVHRGDGYRETVTRFRKIRLKALD